MSAGTTTKIVCWTATVSLVKYADYVLAVYNGERRGGTAATVRYAQKLGREIILIDPVTLSISNGETATSPARSR